MYQASSDTTSCFGDVARSDDIDLSLPFEVLPANMDVRCGMNDKLNTLHATFNGLGVPEIGVCLFDVQFLERTRIGAFSHHNTNPFAAIEK